MMSLMNSGERRCLISLAFCLIGDDTCIEVDGDFIAVLDLLAGFRTFQDRQSDVDGIPVEYTCKSLGDDAVDAACLDGDRTHVLWMIRIRSSRRLPLCLPVLLYLRNLHLYLPCSVTPVPCDLAVFRCLAGIITSVSTLSPYLCTIPCAFISSSCILQSRPVR